MRGLKQLERGSYHGLLGYHVAGRPNRLPGREACEECPWRLDTARRALKIGKRDRWNAHLLNCPRDQSHGLVTDRSDRHQQRRVGAGCRDLVGDGACSGSSKGAGIRDIAHEAIADRCDPADDPVGCELTEPVDGVDTVVIGERMGRIVVAMGDRDSGLRQAGGQRPVGLVTLGV